MAKTSIKRQQIEIRDNGQEHSQGSKLRKDGIESSPKGMTNYNRISISVYDPHIAVLHRCVKAHLFATRSEAIRYCINNSIIDLTNKLEKFLEGEIIEFDNKTIKLIKRLK